MAPKIGPKIDHFFAKIRSQGCEKYEREPSNFCPQKIWLYILPWLLDTQLGAPSLSEAGSPLVSGRAHAAKVSLQLLTNMLWCQTRDTFHSLHQQKCNRGIYSLVAVQPDHPEEELVLDNIFTELQQMLWMRAPEVMQVIL